MAGPAMEQDAATAGRINTESKPSQQKAEADDVGMGEFNAAVVVIRFSF